MFLFRCFCVFGVRGRLFLVAVLVYLCCAGEALEDGEPVKILTFVGQTVILPCHVRVSNDQIPSVEWSKEDLKPKAIVFLYRSGCETFEEKNPTFRYRTNLFMSELRNGNVSLRLSDIQLSDAGTYICKENEIQGPPTEVLRVKLVVGAVSEPRLSVVPAAADDGGDGVTLQCGALCWFLRPEITFHVAEGNIIRSEPMKNDLDSRGCFNITKRVTVKNSNRVTCTVHQPETNEKRVTEIYIPDDCMKSCTAITVAAAIAIIILLASCAFNGYFYKKYNCVGAHKSLQAQISNDSRNAEVYNPTNQADGTRNVSTEHLRETAELKSNLREKEKIIHRLTKEVHELRSKQSPVVRGHGEHSSDNSPSTSSLGVSKPISLPQDKTPHNNNPKPAASTSSNQHKPASSPKMNDSKPAISFQIPVPGFQIQKGRHNHSSPALFPDFNAGASPAVPSLTRSTSVSESPPSSNITKLQRRYTTSISSSNRFSALANLPEDEQELLLLKPEEK